MKRWRNDLSQVIHFWSRRCALSLRAKTQMSISSVIPAEWTEPDPTEKRTTNQSSVAALQVNRSSETSLRERLFFPLPAFFFCSRTHRVFTASFPRPVVSQSWRDGARFFGGSFSISQAPNTISFLHHRRDLSISLSCREQNVTQTENKRDNYSTIVRGHKTFKFDFFLPFWSSSMSRRKAATETWTTTEDEAHKDDLNEDLSGIRTSHSAMRDSRIIHLWIGF